jgi:hypothetical protein
MEQLLNLMTILSLVLFVVVLTSLRREHIRVEYSVSWLAASVVLFTLSRSHAALRRVTVMLGLSDTGAGLIIIVFCVFLVVFYRFSMIISGLKDANIAMAQRVAILEYRIDSLNEQQTK